MYPGRFSASSRNVHLYCASYRFRRTHGFEAAEHTSHPHPGDRRPRSTYGPHGNSFVLRRRESGLECQQRQRLRVTTSTEQLYPEGLIRGSHRFTPVAFTDNTGVGGQTYYYVVSAFDASNVESVG